LPIHSSGSVFAASGGDVRLIACKRCRAQYDTTDLIETTFRCACGETVDASPPRGVDMRVERCGSCGATVDPDGRSCPYCGATIDRDDSRPTLICPECYARSPESARFCTHCGVAFRPQPIETAPAGLRCPRCAREMRARAVGAVRVHECPECEGLWVPGEGFDGLVARLIEAEGASPFEGIAGPARRSAEGSTADGRVAGEATEWKVVYRRCPVCKGVMQRKNFGGSSGVIVDWCGAHGTWLDRDEPDGIADYVRRGGLRRDPESVL
jgi:Zn-finger nucleic acid-binding protein/ribosomal protein L40E